MSASTTLKFAADQLVEAVTEYEARAACAKQLSDAAVGVCDECEGHDRDTADGFRRHAQLAQAAEIHARLAQAAATMARAMAALVP